MRKQPSIVGNAPDLTHEELQRRGEAADALFREIVRRITAKLQPWQAYCGHRTSKK